jgi:hypothetical protein
MAEVYQITAKVDHTGYNISTPLTLTLNVIREDGSGVKDLASDYFHFDIAWTDPQNAIQNAKADISLIQCLPAGCYSGVLYPPKDPLYPGAMLLWGNTQYRLLIRVVVMYTEVTGNPQEVGGHVGKIFHVDAEGHAETSFGGWMQS